MLATWLKLINHENESSKAHALKLEYFGKEFYMNFVRLNINFKGPNCSNLLHLIVN